MDDKKLVSVVFSFRNEQEVLPELVRRLQAVFKPLSYRYELIFVNDSSSDNSLRVLQEERSRDPNIRILNTSRRFGVTPCVLAGLRHAKGDAAIYMDCDLQDPPELIPTLLEKWREGADIVHTTRTRRKGEHAFKMWLTKKAYGIINFISDIEIPPESGDFKLISRRALDEILKLNEFDPFMRGLVAWVGFKQVQVLYEREARFAGETKFSLWRSMNPYKEFIRGLTRFSDLPLYFGLLLGLLVSFASFIYLLVLLVKAATGVDLPAWSGVLVILLLLGAMILFTMGVLGIYIGIIHKEVKNRPHYIIESAAGIEGGAGGEPRMPSRRT